MENKEAATSSATSPSEGEEKKGDWLSSEAQGRAEDKIFGGIEKGFKAVRSGIATLASKETQDKAEDKIFGGIERGIKAAGSGLATLASKDTQDKAEDKIFGGIERGATNAAHKVGAVFTGGASEAATDAGEPK